MTEAGGYAALLGMVDNVGVLAVRDGNLGLQPPGTFLDVDTTQNGWELYVNDAWRLSPTLTLSAGLNYQVYGSPKERDDRYAYLIDNQTGERLDVQTYVSRARTAAEAGQPYNPQLAYLPLADSGRSALWVQRGGGVRSARLLPARRARLRSAGPAIKCHSKIAGSKLAPGEPPIDRLSRNSGTKFGPG